MVVSVLDLKKCNKCGSYFSIGPAVSPRDQFYIPFPGKEGYVCVECASTKGEK